MPTAMKSWSLNVLETFRPVQACIGFALPFYAVYGQVSTMMYEPFYFLQIRPNNALRIILSDK